MYSLPETKAGTTATVDLGRLGVVCALPIGDCKAAEADTSKFDRELFPGQQNKFQKIKECDPTIHINTENRGKTKSIKFKFNGTA